MSCRIPILSCRIPLFFPFRTLLSLSVWNKNPHGIYEKGLCYVFFYMNRLKCHNERITLALRLMVGALFVLSAVLKALSVEQFDLYVYEHGLFSLSVTETLTRLLIAAEFTLGVMLLFRLRFRFAYLCAWLLLAGFTLYLLLLPYLFEVGTENCHCFGEKIVFNRNQSILKNLLMMGMLVPIPAENGRRRMPFWVCVVLYAVALTAIGCYNAPNYLYKMVYKSKVRIDEPLFQSAMESRWEALGNPQGKQLICLYSTQCQYCRKAAKKMQLIFQRERLDKRRMNIVFCRLQPDEEIPRFFEEQEIDSLAYTVCPVDTFLRITHGKMPVILFVDHRDIVRAAEYLTLQEREITAFLREK